MPSLYGEDRWLSVYSLTRDPRILHVSENDAMMFKPPPDNLPSPLDITAIVVASTNDEALGALSTLAGSALPPKIILVCLDPDRAEELAWFPTAYSYMLPGISFFVPGKRLSVGEGMLAGLQNVRTKYFFVIGPYGLIHTDTPMYISAELAKGDYDIFYARRFKVNKHGWALYQTNRLKPIWRTNYVIYKGAFCRNGWSVEAVEAETLKKFGQSTVPAKTDAVLFYTKD